MDRANREGDRGTVTMTENYLIWKYKSVPHACALRDLVGLEKQFRLRQGISLQKDFPGDVAFHMHPDYPNDLLLVDNALNQKRIIVASRKLKEFVEARAIPHVEYLQVGIVDHRGRKASSDYFVIHPIHPVDCVDKKRSLFERDDINPENFSSFERLVIDESRIPTDRELFRLSGFSDITLARRDLAEALDAARFSGLGWLRIADYPGP